MMTSIPQIFMPVVSGYYLEVMGMAQGVRVGLMMFAGAAAIAVVVRALLLTETLDTGEGGEADAPYSFEDQGDGVLAAFRRQSRVIYAMLIAAIISSFASRMTWSFLSIYTHTT